VKTITLEMHDDPLHYKVVNITGAWLSEEIVAQLCADPNWKVFVRKPGKPLERISQAYDGRPAAEDTAGHDRLLEALRIDSRRGPHGC
jgi:hypothetical protein